MTFADYVDAHWFKLPLQLRKRWWKETDYGKNPPNELLQAAVRKAIEDRP